MAKRKNTNNDLQNIHKKLNIALYQRPVTDIRGRFYYSIAGVIIVQVNSCYTYTNYDNCIVLFVFVYLRPISCVPIVADVSGLFIRFSLNFIYYISLLYINNILHILKTFYQYKPLNINIPAVSCNIYVVKSKYKS